MDIDMEEIQSAETKEKWDRLLEKYKEIFEKYGVKEADGQKLLDLNTNLIASFAEDCYKDALEKGAKLGYEKGYEAAVNVAVLAAEPEGVIN